MFTRHCLVSAEYGYHFNTENSTVSTGFPSSVILVILSVLKPGIVYNFRISFTTCTACGNTIYVYQYRNFYKIVMKVNKMKGAGVGVAQTV
jgi:hypothetical protein